MSLKHHISQVRVSVLSRSALIQFQPRWRWLLAIKPLWGFFAWTSLVSFSDVETGAVSWTLPSGTC